MRAVPPSPTASAQLGLRSLGLCLFPPSPQPACGLPLSGHLGVQGPGGQGQTFPSLSWKVQGFPGGMVTATVTEGGDPWPSVTSASVGQTKAPLGQRPLLPQPPLSVISLPSKQLVLPGKLPNESTMQGLWKRSKGRGLVPSTRLTGHNTCRTAEP